jgi:hypothetical protein
MEVIKNGLPEQNEIKSGYKQKEIGGIPEDWQVSEFGNICSPSKIKFNSLNASNRPCIEFEDLTQDSGSLLGIFDSVNKVSLLWKIDNKSRKPRPLS